MTLIKKQGNAKPKLRDGLGWIGIDIQPKSVSLARVRRVKRHGRTAHREMVAAFRIDLCEHGLTASDLIEHDGLSELFSEYEHEVASFGHGNVACTLPAALMRHHQMAIPQSSHAETATMICSEIEAERNQFSGDFTFDFWRTGNETTEQESREFHAVSIDSETVLAVTQQMKTAGWDCDVVDSRFHALARLVGFERTPHNAVLEWGLEDTSLTIVEHGVPQYSRSLKACGLRCLYENLTSQFHLSFGECQFLVKAISKDSESEHVVVPYRFEKRVRELAEPLIHAATDQIQKTLEFATYRLQIPAVSNLTIVGEAETLPGVCPNVSDSLGCRVRPWGLNPGDSCGEFADYGVAVSLSEVGLL